jgi:hypothetical protein
MNYAEIQAIAEVEMRTMEKHGLDFTARQCRYIALMCESAAISGYVAGVSEFAKEMRPKAAPEPPAKPPRMTQYAPGEEKATGERVSPEVKEWECLIQPKV